jgi:hypothetical protein
VSIDPLQSSKRRMDLERLNNNLKRSEKVTLVVEDKVIMNGKREELGGVK